MNEETNQCERHNQIGEMEIGIIDGNQSTATSTIATVGISGENKSPPEMFKLNIDCFEHFFDWLSLQELLKFRLTCKQIKLVVDDYIAFKYSKLRYSKISGQYKPPTKTENLEFCKHLMISFCDWKDADSENIKHVLNQLETLKLYAVDVFGDLYEVLLKYCKQLKHLRLEDKMIANTGHGNEWLRRSYPTLEQFEFEIGVITKSTECSDLLIFFERNPNIRIFTTDSSFLRLNRQILLNSNIRLDRLNIKMYHNLEIIHSLACDLYSRGFYKKLCLSAFCRDSYFQGQEDLLSAFENLETLNLGVSKLSNNFPLVKMNSLKELNIFTFSSSELFGLVATNLINLTYFYTDYMFFFDVELLVIDAPKLEQIKIKCFLGFVSYNTLVTWNAARTGLPHARKVTIFIREGDFLIQKWSSEIDFGLIKLERFESCERNALAQFW